MTIGISGYARFGDSVHSNIIYDYNLDDTLSYIARISLGVPLLLTYPFHCLTFRLTIYLFKEERKKLSFIFYYIVTIVFYFVVLIASVCFKRFLVHVIDYMNIMFIVGAFSNATLLFTLPGLIFIKVGKKKKIFGMLSITVGVILKISIVIYVVTFYIIK